MLGAYLDPTRFVAHARSWAKQFFFNVKNMLG
jgi:hypothetical protein